MKNEERQSKVKLEQFYDANALEYRNRMYRAKRTYAPLRFREKYAVAMVERLNLPPGARVLDVGCGSGELVRALAQKGLSLWGVDLSKRMIDLARNLLREEKVPLSALLSMGDIEKLNFESGYFDVVIAAGVIEYQKEDWQSLAEMRRVLKPEGHLILNVTNRYSYIYFLTNLSTRLRAKAIHAPERRTHSPFRFDRSLSSFGFEKLAHNYFHFSPLPRPLDQVFKPICEPAGKWMENLTENPVAPLLGGGYLAMFRKSKAAECGLTISKAPKPKLFPKRFW